jgi:hypothetical protein
MVGYFTARESIEECFMPGDGGYLAGLASSKDQSARFRRANSGIFEALVYFWQQADSFWLYVGSFFKALFWPALMVYEVFDALGT